jgi:hypothetical protein
MVRVCRFFLYICSALGQSNDELTLSKYIQSQGLILGSFFFDLHVLPFLSVSFLVSLITGFFFLDLVFLDGLRLGLVVLMLVVSDIRV